MPSVSSLTRENPVILFCNSGWAKSVKSPSGFPFSSNIAWITFRKFVSLSVCVAAFEAAVARTDAGMSELSGSANDKNPRVWHP